ncbi:hypothetical protein PGT21_003209 [Puccinia graminis f. sp. tritici]|uniref:Uncharacterized protein n=1 Tax=Puccinia graminis f. sp. tritici TaxID=56615 RepID=A0A5B0PUZ8_PUCGR|nr:hypothetical protein PGTUg99_016464 [Puccinia graminis f. sp. tritici]KAA1103869.1 hypothetical protein PGT21_003209 [Puccinia graminis f. sp. tritici]
MPIHFQSHGLTTINSTQPTPCLQISGHSQFYLASGTSSALPLAASILRLGLAAGACERSKVHIECVARPADKPGILYISSGFKRVKLKQCLLHIRYITRKDPGKHRRRRTSPGTTGQARRRVNQLVHVLAHVSCRLPPLLSALGISRDGPSASSSARKGSSNPPSENQALKCPTRKSGPISSPPSHGNRRQPSAIFPSDAEFATQVIYGILQPKNRLTCFFHRDGDLLSHSASLSHSSRMDAKPTLTPMLLPARRPTRKVEALSPSPRSPRNSGNR